MKGFPGFPDGKLRTTLVPNLFFSDLLPNIDNMAELKVTLYAFWALGQKDGKVRYLRLTDFLNDTEFVKGLGPTTALATEALMDGIERAVARGSFLHIYIGSADGNMADYLAGGTAEYLHPLRTKYWAPHPHGGRRTARRRANLSFAVDRRSD